MSSFLDIFLQQIAELYLLAHASLSKLTQPRYLQMDSTGAVGTDVSDVIMDTNKL